MIRLTKVIFGLDTPADYEDFVLKLLKEADKNPIIEKCGINESNYKIHFGPIKLSRKNGDK